MVVSHPFSLPSNSSTVATRRKQRRHSRRHSVLAPTHKTQGYLNGYLKKRVAFALDSMISQHQESISSQKHQSADLALKGTPGFREDGGPKNASHDVQSTLKLLMSSPSKVPVDTKPYTLVCLGSCKEMVSHKLPGAQVLAREHDE